MKGYTNQKKVAWDLGNITQNSGCQPCSWLWKQLENNDGWMTGPEHLESSLKTKRPAVTQLGNRWGAWNTRKEVKMLFSAVNSMDSDME